MSVEKSVILKYTDMSSGIQYSIPIPHISTIAKFDDHVAVYVVDGSIYNIACSDETLYEKIKDCMKLYYSNISK